MQKKEQPKALQKTISLKEILGEIKGRGFVSDINKATMNKDEFWNVIDETNKIAGKGSQEEFLSAFSEKLSEYSLEAIRDWFAIFRFYYNKAYRNDLWAACAATKTHCSDDGFIDFRYWLISKG